MSRGNPESDLAAAKLRMKALSDPKTRREAQRYYDREDRLELIAKAILLLGALAFCLFLYLS